MPKSSYLNYQKFLLGKDGGEGPEVPGWPSAIVGEVFVPIPLWAVTMMTLSESYHLPPLTSSHARQLVDTHDDTISLSASLIGPDRFLFKEGLEFVAEQSMRGSMLESVSGGAAGGLILVTSMTIRTDMYVQSLTFSANASRRETIDVSMTLAHLPRPGLLSQLLDIAAIGVGAALDFRAD